MKFDQATNLWRGIEVSLLKQRWSKFLKGKILDLGCGEGEIAQEVFGKQLEWGLDNDREMVKKAEQSGMYRQVILGDAAKIPLKSKTVDLVFANSVLEHIKDIDRVLSEVRRVLKPAGLLMATMPSHKLGEYLGWGKLYAQWFNHKYNHYNLLNLTGWKKRLQQHQLQLVEGYYYLDKKTIKQWHRYLYLNKLRIKFSARPAKAEFLAVGAGLAILGKKL